MFIFIRNTPLNPLLIEGKILDEFDLTRRNGTRLGAESKLVKNSLEKTRSV